MPLLALGAGIVAAGFLIARALQGSGQGQGGPSTDPPNRRGGGDPSSGGAGGGAEQPSTQTTQHSVGTYDNNGSTTVQIGGTGTLPNDSYTVPAGGTGNLPVQPQSVYVLPGGYTTNYRVTNPASVPAAAIAPGSRGRIQE